MSRKRRELRVEAEQRWPTLYQFLAAYCHQDWDLIHGSPEGAVDAAVSEYPLAARQTVLREWRDWNVSEGAKYDPRPALNDGLGVELAFDTPTDARQFMNMVYDKLITSVRNETGDRWKPDRKE